MRSLRHHERGVVYAEFIIAFVPFFLLFLGIVQLAFIATGGIVVQSAAVKAVRAATVVLDDDPLFYDDEPRGLLDFNGSTDDDGWVDKVGGEVNSGGAVWAEHCNADKTDCQRTNQVNGAENKGGPRLRAIRRAAYLPLSALSPEWSTLVAWFKGVVNINNGDAEGVPEHPSVLKSAIGESPSLRLLSGFLVYNPIAAAVNFPVKPQEDDLRNAGDGFDGKVCYGIDDKVTVRVTYLFSCGVPIVNHLICKSFFELTGVGEMIGGFEDLFTDPSLENFENAKTKLNAVLSSDPGNKTATMRNFEELQAGAEHPTTQYALMAFRDARFHVLRREATLPVQGAPYTYATKEDKTEDRCKP